MNIRLTDKNNNILDLTSGWGFKETLPESNSKMEKMIFVDGAKQIGDLSLNAKTIEIFGYLLKDSIKDVNAKINEILEFVHYGQPCKLSINGYSDRYLEIYYKSGQAEPIVFSHIERPSIMFDVAYPFWIDSTVQTNEFLNTPTNSTLSLTVSSKPVKPIIKIKSLGNLYDLTLTSATNNGTTSRLYYPTFNANQEVIINCKTGRIYRVVDGLNLKQYFEGSFLTLLRGENSLFYTGLANADITITYQNEAFK